MTVVDAANATQAGQNATMRGWYLVAFERDLVDELTAASLGNRRLVLVKRDGRVRAFDATCPHRGAHLALGGRLSQDAIICPFHAYRIRLGQDDRDELAVAEYAVACGGGMVFVRCSEAADNGWVHYLEELERTHFIINGFEMDVHAPMEAVIENAFDQRHFHAVHGIRTDEFVVRRTEHGALVVESTFFVPQGPTGSGGSGSLAPAPYRALVVSPGLVAVELGGPVTYTVVTGATDGPMPRECTIRLSIAFPKAAWKDGPPAALCAPLLQHSRRGLEDDRVVWENVSPTTQPHWMPEDRPSVEFMEFCAAHRDA